MVVSSHLKFLAICTLQGFLVDKLRNPSFSGAEVGGVQVQRQPKQFSKTSATENLPSMLEALGSVLRIVQQNRVRTRSCMPKAATSTVFCLIHLVVEDLIVARWCYHSFPVHYLFGSLTYGCVSHHGWTPLAFHELGLSIWSNMHQTGTQGLKLLGLREIMSSESAFTL